MPRKAPLLAEWIRQNSLRRLELTDRLLGPVGSASLFLWFGFVCIREERRVGLAMTN